MYRVFPQYNTIMSEQYQASDIGSHTLNITLADTAGSQFSFQLQVGVTARDTEDPNLDPNIPLSYYQGSADNLND